MSHQAVILAAGMGTRLGRPYPKSLVKLADGRSILQQQLDNLRSALDEVRVMIVVGFKRELIMEEFADVAFAYNEFYAETNTSKSLLKALRLSADAGVLWLNGDVVFDVRILDRVRDRMVAETSFVCVNRTSVGDEEVKYTFDDDGYVRELSKTISDADGEAIGINFIGRDDKKNLIERLEEVADDDYFERGIELAIARDGLRFEAVDISDLFALEIDFESDLRLANEAVAGRG